ncbi:hypothetical protein ABZX95_42290 [Streptomyces sp. NPDC004232]|uniref:hypothetical protein n=1 Tax=Streptomyces sp. NPDC004232 TaxID=3154454 RepID=UPI0033AFC7E7
MRDAGGTWLPIALVEPRRPYGHEPEPESIVQPNGYVSVGLSLSTYPGNQGYFGKTVPIVLPPTARIRWDAHRAEGSRRPYTYQPVPFGQSVISLYGR